MTWKADGGEGAPDRCFILTTTKIDQRLEANTVDQGIVTASHMTLFNLNGDVLTYVVINSEEPEAPRRLKPNVLIDTMVDQGMNQRDVQVTLGGLWE